MKTLLSGALIQLLALTLPAATILAVRSSAQTGAESELMRYIRGDKADPACGVCLGSARRHFEDIAREKLLKKTAGMALIPAGKYRLGSPEERKGSGLYF